MSLSLHLAAYSTGRIVPVHAMEPYGGVEVQTRSSLTLVLMGVSGQLQVPAGLPPEAIDYEECVVFRAGLEALEKTKTSLSISLPAIERRFPGRPAHSLACTPAHFCSEVG